MEQQTKTNLLNPDTWVRLIYMLVFGLLSFLARMVVWVVAVLQFLLVLVTGSGNSNLRDLGQGVSKWTYQAFLFLTFNTDEKPYPFSDWPEIDQPEEVEGTGEESDSSESEHVDDVPAFVDEAEEIENKEETEKVDPDQSK